MSRSRDSKPADTDIANDNVRKRELSERLPERFPEVKVRLPREMPVQLVEVEVLAELLESLPAIANDNSEDSE